MGKALIIKGANFYAIALDTIDERYEDITETTTFVQGLVSRVTASNLQAQAFNSSHNPASTLIPRYLTNMPTDSTLYDTSDKGYEWFIPTGLKINVFVYKPTSTIASDGKISDSHTDAITIAGSGSWVSAIEIYQTLGVSQSTYPCYSVSVSRNGSSTNLTIAEAKALGLRIRKLKETE